MGDKRQRPGKIGGDFRAVRTFCILCWKLGAAVEQAFPFAFRGERGFQSLQSALSLDTPAPLPVKGTL